jgi:hypothetical protein
MLKNKKINKKVINGTYAMAFKNGKDILHKTQQSTLKQATEYFAEVKQMPIKDLKKYL